MIRKQGATSKLNENQLAPAVGEKRPNLAILAVAYLTRKLNRLVH